MNRILLALACAALAAAAPAAAQVYKWTDENGKVHYGDRPQGARPATTVAPPVGSAPPAGGASSLEECHTITCQGMRADQKKGAAQGGATRSSQASSSTPRTTTPSGPAAAERERAAAMEKCKANRGVDCDKPSAVNQWVQQDRPLTREQQQAAINDRNARRQREAMRRY